MGKKNKSIILILAMILIAAISRLLPHPPNFTPVAAMAMFGGTYFLNKRIAIIVPIVILFLSNLVLNNSSIGYVVDSTQFTWFTMYSLWVFIPMIITVFIGMRLTKKVNMTSVIGYTLLSSLVFFLMSNFGSFLSLPIYTKNIAGLFECYIAAIPFFRNELLGNLIYSTVLYGIYEWISYKRFILIPSKA